MRTTPTCRARPATFMQHGMPQICTGLVYNTAEACLPPRACFAQATLHGVVFEKIYPAGVGDYVPSGVRDYPFLGLGLRPSIVELLGAGLVVLIVLAGSAWYFFGAHRPATVTPKSRKRGPHDLDRLYYRFKTLVDGVKPCDRRQRGDAWTRRGAT